LQGYRRSWLRDDTLAGLSVAAYLVPQAMAYATLAGLNPAIGLWAALPPLAVYAVLGSSRLLAVGPESTAALMTSAVLASVVVDRDPAAYAAYAATLAILVGVVCFVAGLMKLGFLADLLSKPVLVGYMTGIAFVMVVSQLSTLTGVPIASNDVVGRVREFAGDVTRVHWPTMALAAVVLATVIALERRAPRFPGPLIGAVVATVVVAVFALSNHGINVIGAIPSGIPPPGLPEVSAAAVRDLIVPAMGIAMVAFSDDVLTARGFAGRTADDIDANAELRALGVCNLIVGMLRGFPVSSSGSRTALAVAAGARTQVYALVTLFVLLGVIVAGRSVVALIPSAALGALVVYAATKLIDIGGFRRIARAHDSVQGLVPGLAGMHDVDDYPDASTIPGLLVYRYDAPLCFANADDFLRRALAAVDQSSTPVRWFVLNAEANVEVDLTAMDALDRLRLECEHRGIVFAMARVKQDLRDAMNAAGILGAIGEGRMFMTLPTAVEAFKRSRDIDDGSS
jgi:SulP family sulfate permease